KALHARRHHRQRGAGRAGFFREHSPGRLSRRSLSRKGGRRPGGEPKAPLAGRERTVKSEHLLTFLWLRWRLRGNQLKRGGIANAVIGALLAGAAVCLAGILFVVFLLVGLWALPEAPPATILYVWDGVVVAFLFFWAVGLFGDLQRAEALSLDKFLHLPVSLTGAFLVNYVSSLVSLTLVVFLRPMLGLALALVFAKGPAMLWLFPLLAAFLLMVTALTYQFQGWLAALMANKRRRRTVIVVATLVFVLIFQLPNL